MAEPQASAAHDAPELEVADALGRELMRFVRLINYFKTHVMPPRKGIEHSAYPLLGTLVFVGPQRMTTLAEAVHADLSTVSRQVSALVKTGWVERQADPEDGRACLLAATTQGHALFDELRTQRTEHFAALLSGWDRADQLRLVELFGRLNGEIESYDPRLAAAAAGRAGEGEVR
jgi:DNA-binding MarR family transcriptional regulator